MERKLNITMFVQKRFLSHGDRVEIVVKELTVRIVRQKCIVVLNNES